MPLPLPSSIVSDQRPLARSRSVRVAAFTLAELLAVITIILLVVALTVPAVNALKGARDTTAAAYDLAGALESARTYALANNTYVWVGFYEEDGGRASQNPAVVGNGGRVVVSVVASRDGTRYVNAIGSVPPAFGDPAGTVALVQLNKLLKIDGARLAALNDPSGAANTPPGRPCRSPASSATPPVPRRTTPPAFARTTFYPTGNKTTFTYPVPSATQANTGAQYVFAKIIEFNPQGEASKITENTYGGAGPQSFLEIALQPARGNAVDPRYAGANASRVGAALQVEGLTGQVKVYRP